MPKIPHHAGRKFCAYCGTGQRRLIDNEPAVIFPAIDAPPDYLGNAIVVRTRIDIRDNGMKRIRRDVWDGESYCGFYSDLFCRLSCAWAFAAAAHKAGYRMKQPAEPRSRR
jgi:hypothetical protein